jgi:hypothetical protein
MNFQPQPYPLFFAKFGPNDAVETGRIIGWAVPSDDNSSNLQPVALVDNADDGAVTEPKYLEVENDPHWLGETRAAAVADLEKQRANRAALLRGGPH